MSEKKPTLFACSDCGMYGTNDDFVRKSKDQCRKCVRVSQLEEKACYSEEKRVETLTKSMHALATCSQKTEGDQMETESGSMDRDDVVLGKEGRSTEQLKEQKPVAEIATKAVGGTVNPYVDHQQIKKTEMEDKIKSAIKAKHFFLIGVAKRDGSALESLQKYEQRTLELHERYIQDINAYEVKVVKVFYTTKLSAENGYALESAQLRDKYRKKDLCLNAKSGDDELFREEDAREGIAFLREYC